jgi:hypothetical protein
MFIKKLPDSIANKFLPFFCCAIEGALCAPSSKISELLGKAPVRISRPLPATRFPACDALLKAQTRKDGQK